MQRRPRVIVIVLGLMAAYVVWPLYTALQIRDAMISGDTATLARKIEWDTVRASLKVSMSPEAIARLEADPNAPPPSLWQRVKSVVAPRLAGTVIDRYVTPENLPVLLGYRRFWRGTVQPALGREEPPTALAGTLFAGSSIDRFVSFWRRLRRAVFQSLTRIEIEVQDRYLPGRYYTGTLELRGFEWKLTGLTVTGL